MKTVLEYKWKAYARQLFMRELLLFVVALALFTSFTLLASGFHANETLVEVATGHGFSGVCMVLLALILPISSLRQLNLEYRQVRPGVRPCVVQGPFGWTFCVAPGLTSPSHDKILLLPCALYIR